MRYLEASRTSKMALFVKIFLQNAPSLMFNWLLNTSLVQKVKFVQSWKKYQKVFYQLVLMSSFLNLNKLQRSFYCIYWWLSPVITWNDDFLCYILEIPVTNFMFTYSSSCNLTPPISWLLIGRHLSFCPLTWQTCCNSPRKCTPVKYKARQKAMFPIITYTTSYSQL